MAAHQGGLELVWVGDQDADQLSSSGKYTTSIEVRVQNYFPLPKPGNRKSFKSYQDF
jgi:hypothetical protein